MSRGQGRVYRPHNHTGLWWLDYTVGGKRHRESSETTSKRAAYDLLRQRVGDRKDGKLDGDPRHVVLAVYTGEGEARTLTGGLRSLVERQYAIDGNKSVKRVCQAFAHLEAFFGAATRARDITETRLDAYAEHRLGEGAARATMQYELRQLRRGFRLALKKKLLAVMPTFELKDPKNARSGFFEEGEFAAVLLELPSDVRDLIQFLHATAWRRTEGRLLPWASVDRDGGVIRLEGARSKSGKPRTFPYGLSPTLTALLDRRWAARDGLYVFHRDGRALTEGMVRRAWEKATKRAGLDGRLVHDLRRTAARDFRRAGISEGVVMQLAGWKTRSMFDRYNIVDEKDLAQAVAKRDGNGNLTATSPAPAQPTDPLSSSPA